MDKIKLLVVVAVLTAIFSLPPLFWAFQKWDCLFFPNDTVCQNFKR